jgi:hypothetical protein
MMEKLLVFLMYECHQQSVPVPWDAIVHRLQPGSSGPSAFQYIEKLRYKLIAEGHIVPPLKTKPYLPPDPNVRALVRADPNGPPGRVRIVKWNEHIEHPKKSLDNPGISNGSGRYCRGSDGRRSRAGARRDEPQLKVEYPEEYLASTKAIANSVSAEKTKARRQRAKERKKGNFMVPSKLDAEERGEVADPADLSSDGDYVDGAPATKKSRTRYSPRNSRAKKSDESDEINAVVPAHEMMQFGSTNEETGREASSLPVKFSIAPEKLAIFILRQAGSSALEKQVDHVEDDNARVEDTEDDDASDPELRKDIESSAEYDESDEYEEGDGEVEYGEQMQIQESFDGYSGPNEHGDLQSYFVESSNDGLVPGPADDAFDSYGIGQQNRWKKYPVAASPYSVGSDFLGRFEFD